MAYRLVSPESAISDAEDHPATNLNVENSHFKASDSKKKDRISREDHLISLAINWH